MEQVLTEVLLYLGGAFFAVYLFLKGVGLVAKVLKAFLQILIPLIVEIRGEIGEVRKLLIEIFKLVI